MKIAIVSPGLFSVPPVMGSSVEHDIDQVSRVLAIDHEVLVYTCTCSKYPTSTEDGSLKMIRFPYRGQRPYIDKVAKDLQNQDVDVILVENRPRFVPIIRKVIKKVPIVVNMHSHVFASSNTISPSLLQKSIKQMDAMITNSKYLRRFLIRTHHIPSHKVKAVHLGVNIEPYLNMKNYELGQKKRAELGYEPEDRVLFYAGRLMKEKGVHLLLQSFHEVAKRDEHARLLIIGGTGYGSNRKNSYVRNLHKLAKPIKDKVRFKKFVPTSEMPIWYQVGDVVATPSIWNEPFCRVNIEGMASGKPIFTTTRGGTTEVVKNKETGYCIHPDKWKSRLKTCWNEIWSDENKRIKLSENAIQRALELTWEATANGYIEVFQRVIDEKSEKK